MNAYVNSYTKYVSGTFISKSSAATDTMLEYRTHFLKSPRKVKVTAGTLPNIETSKTKILFQVFLF